MEIYSRGTPGVKICKRIDHVIRSVNNLRLARHRRGLKQSESSYG